MNNLNQVGPGDDLRGIVSANGFSLHPDKVWLRRQDRRQEVTGVTVNEFPNVTRRFTNQIRAMLHAWETYGVDAAQSDFEKVHDHKHRAPWSGRPSFKRVVKGKIEYLGMIKGKESSTYLQCLDQLGRLAPDIVGARGTPRELLLRRYDALVVSQDPHGRGYHLQDLLQESFKLFDVPVEKSFTRNEGGDRYRRGLSDRRISLHYRMSMEREDLLMADKLMACSAKFFVQAPIRWAYSFQ